LALNLPILFPSLLLLYSNNEANLIIFLADILPNKSVMTQLTPSNTQKSIYKIKFLSINHHVFVILIFSFESVTLDYSSQQVVHSDSFISTPSSSFKTSKTVDSLNQIASPLSRNTVISSPATVPTNIETQSESVNLSFNNEFSSYGGSHLPTFASILSSFYEIKKYSFLILEEKRVL
jgi:hypothetical protein